MPGSVQSIERAAAILQVIAGSGGRLGLREISEAVGLAKTTAHGLLRTLVTVGFVAQDRRTGRYELGAGLLSLGTSYLDDNELRARASNWTDALASRSGSAVRLGTLAGTQVVVVHHVFRPDDSAQELEVGTALPAHATALGKVLLACQVPLPPLPQELERFTRATSTTAAELAPELQETRTRGWALEREEHLPGVAGLAAPVRGAAGLVVGALGITAPVAAVLDGRGAPRPALVGMVTDAATAVSRELGERRPEHSRG
ncbi:IclR family transcriptional regulator [Blastococcus sp. TF02A-30]|uniref:IclR family transcriptional regulator n=1 Tax=Blastococcus sp. TF02A-30 TaxID=2250580 RepID=UPI000DEBD325|nr:IclR family transcriptional regulator [Blastococcus sp. TF02A-30]RBY93273.1 IclR family transcriptional regulator [Blastococcus sp. TF02A-30]